ncbi:MAG: class II SORL domain-containing protein [Thermoplasmata archaeon]|nr:class II SORL domain-containing protein [Thermoplasmata archaeon]
MLKDEIQSGDWKGEKHVPAIEILEKKDGMVKVEVSVGKEIKHPNTIEHHIAWIELYFKPDGEKFPKMIGRVAFTSHDDLLTEPIATFTFRTEKKGKIYALSFCNIHGLWESEVRLE